MHGWYVALGEVLLFGGSGSAGVGLAGVRDEMVRSEAIVLLRPTRLLRSSNGHLLGALAAADGQVAVFRIDACSPIIIWNPRSGRVQRVPSGSRRGTSSSASVSI